MAAPVIRSATLTPSTVAPGGSSTLVVDGYDPDARTADVRVTLGGATAVTRLVVADPLPAPTFVEVDANGDPVAESTLDIVPDPTDPMRAVVTARVL